MLGTVLSTGDVEESTSKPLPSLNLQFVYKYLEAMNKTIGLWNIRKQEPSHRELARDWMRLLAGK